MARRKKKQVYSTMFRATPHLTENGTYRIQVVVGKTEAGKNIVKSFTAPTPFEAVKMAEDYIQGKKDEKEKMTVGQAIDKYIGMKENVLSPTTIRSYKSVRAHQMQEIMSIPISEITNEMIQICINREAIRLSPKSLRNVKGLLASALAVYRPDFVIRVTLPAKKNKIKDFPEISDILKMIKDTEIELPCLLAIWLSLRMSEIRGIRYSDISDDGTLTVRNTVVDVDGARLEKDQTKTFKSTRQLQVPDYIMELINEQRQKSESDYLVTLSGVAIYERFTRMLKRNGLKHMSFHDLRHLNASVMLMLGVPDKYAMERGGWSSNYTLQNVYQHTFSAKRREIDNQIDDFFNHLITGNSQDST